MEFNLWSILLIASASQCFFLFLVLARKASTNRQAKYILLSLLGVVLVVNVSNLITASFLYRDYIQYSGFGRGMVLLLGPLFLLYVRAIIDVSHKFRALHLLHFAPYIIAVAIIQYQKIGVSDELFIMSVDALMAGDIPMTLGPSLWFLTYFGHLMTYLILVRRNLNTALSVISGDYRIGLEHRITWLRKLNLLFMLITFLFLAISGYCLIANSYAIAGNFLYTLLLACIVYLIADQAIRDPHVLAPHFAGRYGGQTLDSQWASSIRDRLTNLFETEKIFTDPDIKLHHVAHHLETKPYLISKLINSEFGLSFSEYLNRYRIEEFKLRIVDSKFENHSIMGVAYGVGYNSKSTFNSAFKRLEGKTPTQYLASLDER